MNYFDSARQSQIEGFLSERGGLSPCGKDDEEDRFGFRRSQSKWFRFLFDSP
jgi:hypothetical protein